ncbi:disease resistance protein RUN1-like [Actinidia eriantha]|uniref:disease resistance protein RUN1-like n=1 Tax=Actinidia eriantha TaxID=165200 RepID=UPI002586E510|nr:disease resistance protein RUN1-like [Actinidia eriantha]
MDSSIKLPISTFTPRWSYDVFLSFRGEDTRESFISHLYTSLDQKGIHTFKDENIEKGNEIPLNLLKAIEESRVSIVVLSQNYASSRWCLDELVKIMEQYKKKNALMGHSVCPVFYHVTPSEVRGQNGKFGEGFAQTAAKQEVEVEVVHRWRKALVEVANLSGWPYPSAKNW